jgi:hypothetical protein
MKEYNAMLGNLEEHNIPIRRSEFDGQAMGSWFIEINSNPLYRVAHEGRDKTIVLEVNRKNEWNCLISDKTKSGKHVIKRLVVELDAL